MTMKKILMIVAFALIGVAASAQSQGLQFLNVKSFNSALEYAQSQDKILMVDVYTTWCGPCQHLSNSVFPSAELTDLNEVMVSYKIDAEKGEGVSFAKKWKVASYPTMLFFYEGQLIGTMVGGAYDAEHFMERVAKEIFELDEASMEEGNTASLH